MKLEKTCFNYVFSIYGKWAIPEKKRKVYPQPNDPKLTYEDEI